MVNRYFLKWLCSIFLLAVISACSSTSISSLSVPSPSQSQGSFKIGKPYQVAGNWYYPSHEEDYDKIGIASWYGPGFHGKKTANGDIYNKNELTAAHPTLPMPSMVRVTNLENGRSVTAMINDRGPFSKQRIIDLSEKTAEILHMKRQGFARVRVQYLSQETEELYASLDMRPSYSKTRTNVASYQRQQHPKAKVQQVAYSPNDTVYSPRPVKQQEDIHEWDEQNSVYAEKWFVQAGVYRQKESATRLAESLSSLGAVAVNPYVESNATHYRVRLGPIKDQQHAIQLLEKVATQHADAILVTEYDR